MFIWILLFISGISGITCTKELIKDIDKMNFGDISRHKGIYSLSTDMENSKDEFLNEAAFGDAEHRGSSWYSFKTSDSAYNSDAAMGISQSSSAQASESEPESQSSDASSQDTKERKRAARMYRDCTGCPTDMLKSHKNIGIRWICGGYQRARRSFKSECMMRYRNCQDGTMFVKIGDHRCKNDSFHGRHWFYQYKV